MADMTIGVFMCMIALFACTAHTMYGNVVLGNAVCEVRYRTKFHCRLPLAGRSEIMLQAL
jgi:hypothetical protein